MTCHQHPGEEARHPAEPGRCEHGYRLRAAPLFACNKCMASLDPDVACCDFGPCGLPLGEETFHDTSGLHTYCSARCARGEIEVAKPVPDGSWTKDMTPGEVKDFNAWIFNTGLRHEL